MRGSLCRAPAPEAVRLSTSNRARGFALTSPSSPVVNPGFFVTGTDTGIGKALVASALLRAFALSGVRAVGMKPVATGCRADAQDRANEDVAALIAASNVSAPIDLVNPYCFAPAIAPHIAARQAGKVISLMRIRVSFRALARLADRIVVEGAGGHAVALGPQGDRGDLVSVLNLAGGLVL